MKLLPIFLLPVFLLTSLEVRAEDSYYPFYPTQKNSEEFLGKNCRGIFGGVAMGLTPEKRPMLLNACLLHAIIVGDKKGVDNYLQAGASPQASWPTQYKDRKNEALWPTSKGEITDENGRGERLAGSFASLASSALANAVRDMGEIPGVSDDGLGFNAVTLAIQKNDADTLQKLIAKDKSLLEYSDNFHRCPMIYAYVKNRKSLADIMRAANPKSASCTPNKRMAIGQAAQIQQHLSNTDNKSFLGFDTNADWIVPQPIDLITAMVRSKNYAAAKEELSSADTTLLVKDLSQRKDTEALGQLSSGLGTYKVDALFTRVAAEGFSEGIAVLEKNGLKLDEGKILSLVSDKNPGTSSFGIKLANDRALPQEKVVDAILPRLKAVLEVIYKKRSGGTSDADLENLGNLMYAASDKNISYAELARINRQNQDRREQRVVEQEEYNQVIKNADDLMAALENMDKKAPLTKAQQDQLVEMLGATSSSFFLPKLYGMNLTAEALANPKMKNLIAALNAEGKYKEGMAIYVDQLLARKGAKQAMDFATGYKYVDENMVLDKILATNPEKKTIDDLGLLHFALTKADDAKGQERISKIMTLGADLNVRNSKGVKPLQVLVQNTKDGDPLLKNGIIAGMDPCEKTEADPDLMLLASSMGKLEHALTLYAFSSDEGIKYSSLVSLVKNPQVNSDKVAAAVKKFANEGVRVNQWSIEDKNLLMEAVGSRCEPELTKELLKQNFNMAATDKNYLTALDYAVQNATKQLSTGAYSCNSDTFLRLRARCMQNVQLLVNQGATTNLDTQVKMRCTQ